MEYGYDVNMCTGQVQIRVRYGQASACAVLVPCGADRQQWCYKVDRGSDVGRYAGDANFDTVKRRCVIFNVQEAKAHTCRCMAFHSQCRIGCVDQVVPFLNKDCDFALQLAHAFQPLSHFQGAGDHSRNGTC